MKQTIEIEVPSGKKAVWENNQVKFVDAEPHWKSIKNFDDAYEYCLNNRENFLEPIDSYNCTSRDTYEDSVTKLRLVIAALTNNEKVSLVKGDLYFPVVQFCPKDSIDKCFGNKIIGKIKSEGKEYVVVGGIAFCNTNNGLGCVNPLINLSNASTYINFLQVSSIEIAKHLSTYFGKLIFEVMYGSSNCDWEWVE